MHNLKGILLGLVFILTSMSVLACNCVQGTSNGHHHRTHKTAMKNRDNTSREQNTYNQSPQQNTNQTNTSY